MQVRQKKLFTTVTDEKGFYIGYKRMPQNDERILNAFYPVGEIKRHLDYYKKVDKDFKQTCVYFLISAAGEVFSETEIVV